MMRKVNKEMMNNKLKIMNQTQTSHSKQKFQMNKMMTKMKIYINNRVIKIYFKLKRMKMMIIIQKWIKKFIRI